MLGSARCDSGSLLSLKLAIQPRFGEAPLTFDRARRAAEHTRGFFDRESGEEAKLDDANLIRILNGKPLERFVDGQNVGDACVVRLVGGDVERHEHRPATALLCVPGARVVDEDSTHDLADDPEELRAVLPGRPPLVHQAQVGFVHQRRRIERVIAVLAAKLARGDPPALVIDERQ